MYPEVLPGDVESPAEKQMFELFREQLSDDYIVMHGVHWIDPNPGRFHEEGEADFVIVHERLGIIVLEVKGGGIELVNGGWFTTNRSGETDRLRRNPSDQVGRSMRALRRRAQRTPATREFFNRKAYHFQVGVVLPEITVGPEGLGPDHPRDIIIDSTDLATLEHALVRIAGVRLATNRMSAAAIKAFVNLVKPTRKIAKPGQLSAIIRSGREIDALTEQQYAVLQSLKYHRQRAIPGCAGSGKTMLAVRKATELAQDGLRVLLTCHNVQLGDWLRRTMRESEFVPTGMVRVGHFDGLARDLLREAGIPIPPKPANVSGNHYFNNVLPGALFDAMDEINERFDAIIVDEGQDFADRKWPCLQSLLTDQDAGIFLIFFDSEQRIFQDWNTFPVPVSDSELTINCRNTDPIYELLMRYFTGDRRPESSKIEGLPPDILPVAAGNRFRTLESGFSQLFDEEGVPTSDVVILTPAGAQRSILEQGDKIGNYRLTWTTPTSPYQIRVSTIHRFKGLESPVVVLVPEFDHIPRRAWDSLLYVGISRAKQHLVVIGELPHPQRQNTGVNGEISTEGVVRPIEVHVPSDEDAVELLNSPQEVETAVAEANDVFTNAQVTDFVLIDPPDPATFKRWSNRNAIPVEEDTVDSLGADSEAETVVADSNHVPTNNPASGLVLEDPPGSASFKSTKPSRSGLINPMHPTGRITGGNHAQTQPSNELNRSNSSVTSNSQIHYQKISTKENYIGLITHSGGPQFSRASSPGFDAMSVLPTHGESLAAALCYLVWFLAPILVLLSPMGSRPFTKIHAYQSLAFATLSLIYLLIYGSVAFSLGEALPLLWCVLWMGFPVPLAVGLYLAYRVFLINQVRIVFLTDFTRAFVKNL